MKKTLITTGFTLLLTTSVFCSDSKEDGPQENSHPTITTPTPEKVTNSSAPSLPQTATAPTEKPQAPALDPQAALNFKLFCAMLAIKQDVLTERMENVRKLIMQGPKTTEVDEKQVASTEDFPYQTKDGKLVSLQDFQMHQVKVMTTLLNFNDGGELLSPIDMVYLLMMFAGDYIDSYGLKRRWH